MSRPPLGDRGRGPEQNPSGLNDFDLGALNRAKDAHLDDFRANGLHWNNPG
jgi:hypothetical protein